MKFNPTVQVTVKLGSVVGGGVGLGGFEGVKEIMFNGEYRLSANFAGCW